MAHLHVPDGVLPAWLWVSGWGLAIVTLLLAWRAQGGRAAQRVAYEGALGALMLAAMAVDIPIGPVEYHLTLAGPIGVLLGPAGAFQAAFIASAILAFMGHGGLTVIGLNALLVGLAASVAFVTSRGLGRGRDGAFTLALATAVGHGASGVVWLFLMLLAARTRAADIGVSGEGSLKVMTGLALVMVLGGVVAESAVAFGMGRFISRVRPDLLPFARPRATAP